MTTKQQAQVKNALIKRLTSLSSLVSSSIADKNLQIQIDPFELQVCKIMIDEILEQLKNGGSAEAEIVKKYKF